MVLLVFDIHLVGSVNAMADEVERETAAKGKLDEFHVQLVIVACLDASALAF